MIVAPEDYIGFKRQSPARFRSQLIGRITAGRAMSHFFEAVLAGEIDQEKADEERQETLAGQDEHGEA